MSEWPSSRRAPEKPRRGRPPKSTAVLAPRPGPPADAPWPALDALEQMDAAPREAAAAQLEALRARCRAAHAPVPGVIEQLRALQRIHGPEVQRLARLPFNEYVTELGASTVVEQLRATVIEALNIFEPRAHADFTVPSTIDQLARLGPQIENLTLDDTERAEGIIAHCRRAEEWPATVVRLMDVLRDLTGRLHAARRARGAGQGVAVAPAPATAGISVVISSDAQRSEFDALG